ncbi:MAG: tRNA (adenosine(37)-N6)-threonylcarbamoyltransferase complex transferase subunit TsaD [Clostridia bacterium]|nr:tRNA (adenosine(37)-N6)-threonylcarbamoyltransferase complex transferase subunit TsaD [Clostridia bacterium]
MNQLNNEQLNKDIVVLSIESSCDETSAAVVKNGREVLSNVIATQIDIHKRYGGVVPEIASRNHVDCIYNVITEALDEANVKLEDIDLVAATYGPGLVGALLVGLSTAKAMAFSANKPFLGVHHIEGHIAANYVTHKELEPPYICLVVSGGHSNLVYVKDYTEFEILGRTRDDAVGEAFDKVSRVIGLEYPGGPKIDKLAKEGTPSYKLPKTFFEDSLDFSFSGIKTAVINLVHKEGEKIRVPDLCASFEESITDVLLNNLLKACELKGTNKVALAGGVSANSYLRSRLDKMGKENNLLIYYPELKLCTDNAAMIGAAAYFDYINGKTSSWDLNAVPYLKLGDKLRK